MYVFILTVRKATDFEHILRVYEEAAIENAMSDAAAIEGVAELNWIDLPLEDSNGVYAVSPKYPNNIYTILRYDVQES